MVDQQQLPGAPRRLGRGRDDRRVPVHDMNTGVVPLMGCMGVGRTPLHTSTDRLAELEASKSPSLVSPDGSLASDTITEYYPRYKTIVA